MSFPKRNFPLIWLAGLFLLNVVIRSPFIGHFLTSDEAWILCSLRDFAESKQLFSIQLGKHPPVYLGLGMLLAPTSAGFDIRMQILSLVISSGTLVFFIILLLCFSSSCFAKKKGYSCRYFFRIVSLIKGNSNFLCFRLSGIHPAPPSSKYSPSHFSVFLGGSFCSFQLVVSFF